VFPGRVSKRVLNLTEASAGPGAGSRGGPKEQTPSGTQCMSTPKVQQKSYSKIFGLVTALPDRFPARLLSDKRKIRPSGRPSAGRKALTRQESGRKPVRRRSYQAKNLQMRLFRTSGTFQVPPRNWFWVPGAGFCASRPGFGQPSAGEARFLHFPGRKLAESQPGSGKTGPRNQKPVSGTLLIALRESSKWLRPKTYPPPEPTAKWP